uniref:Laminin subunit alpha-2 n=1 Tax=Phallusia mammillata TaxID=59560 RepID=A0A6F9DJJ2_9ASCI|nr:laminin subunit alpha-2 [Phallusia mammillata]
MQIPLCCIGSVFAIVMQTLMQASQTISMEYAKSTSTNRSVIYIPSRHLRVLRRTDETLFPDLHLPQENNKSLARNERGLFGKTLIRRRGRISLGQILAIARDLCPCGVRELNNTKQYYYSIKDISIGGMCICYGHASTCPTDSRTGIFRCACEHNTVGPNCEQCLPGFQQYKWRPGNDGFQCEACNCHGHSDDCFYDEGVAERRESLNQLGEYLGGGVCVGCKDNTEGINCQTCIDGFYRPYAAEPDDVNPCVSCDCDPYGGRRVPSRTGPYVCVKDITFIDSENDLYPGSCYCNEGFAGSRCDRCAFGYRGFPRCDPCPCNVAGSRNVDPCVGECACKANVVGEGCSQCKTGYFNMQRDNPSGCERCYCSGVALNCASADLRWSTIHTNHNWEVRDRRNRRRVTPQFDYDLNEPYVEHGQTARDLGTAMYYWAAPVQYLGERLSSYGGTLRYTVSYDILQGSQALPIQDADVIMEGNGRSLTYNYMGSLVYPQEETEVLIKLEANKDRDVSGWVDSNSLLPASKEEIMTVLQHVTRLYIRAVYSRNAGAVYRIRDVYMQAATENGEGATAHSVEKCRCPPGYTGFSCENCAGGYWRSGRMCLPCQCNGHSNSCNPLNGACENCQHNTMGMHCERCKPGFYGDSTTGTRDDCQMCSCPLPIASNNFSPLCYLDRTTSEMVCLKCPTGYAGKRCETCEQGYFGDPTTPGGSCQLCECNGNSQSCDSLTGVCTYCRGHTSGKHCEVCEPAYYGDAIERKNCGPCECNAVGSVSRQCHLVTGQCSCRPGVYGRKCDACESGHYLSAEERMCVACECDATGSLSEQCGADGSCICRSGVEGRRCNSCARGYFAFSELGCIECNCQHTNGNCDTQTGECICPTNTHGSECSQCVENAFGIDSVNGCELCNCSDVGSLFTNTCDNSTGQCTCKPEYDGRQCNTCKRGFYGYPNCRPCNCNKIGTAADECDESRNGSCNCQNDGQCVCKANVVGKQCDQCGEGYFGLSESNPLGCSECFCFGAADLCIAAQGYSWGPPIALNSAPVEVLNPSGMANIIEGLIATRDAEVRDADVVIRDIHSQPYYWRLPEQFNGDKLLSYGGKLRYTIYHVSQVSFEDEEIVKPSVVLKGGRGSKITIQYQLDSPQTGQSRDYVVSMRELGWTHLDTSRSVTRAEFATILSDIEFFLIKATYGRLMGQSRLSNVFLDIAQTMIRGRGDAGSNYPPATSIEQCFCYPGYTGSSCQNCDSGYMRIQQGSNYGRCEACNCNNRSSTCDIMTGVCLNCQDKFIGVQCEMCSPGYYLSGNECRKCACPGPDPFQNFSPNCHPDGADGIADYTCDACKTGYEGKHCERCSDGYYGDPTHPGGFCAKCGCNVAGSLDGVCDKVTGQCRCDEGISGRICDQCMPRHIISHSGCQECNDGCSSKLLDDIEILTYRASRVKIHTMFPPPWDRLIAARNLTQQLQKRVENETEEILNRLAVVVSVPDRISATQRNISSLQPQANECKNSGKITVSDVRETKQRLKTQKTSTRFLSNVIEGFSRTLSRFVHQLRNGTTEEIIGMEDKLEGWVNTMRQRSFDNLRRIAYEELETSAVFLDMVAANFTAQYLSRLDSIRTEQSEIVNNLTNVMETFDEFRYLLGNSTSIVAVTNTMNQLNQQTLRQTKSNMERVNNRATIVGVSLSNSESQVEDTRILIQNASAAMANLGVVFNGLLAELPPLRKIRDGLMGGVDAVVPHFKDALRHVTDLQSDVQYIKSVHRNITEFSYNQTEAATRWTQIANKFDLTDQRADSAVTLSMDALNSITTDLGKRSEVSLQRSQDINDAVTSMENNLNGDRRLLRNQNEALRYENQSVADLAKQHERIQTRLKDTRKQSKTTLKRVRNAVNQATKKLIGLKKSLYQSDNTLRQLQKTEMDVSQRSFVINETTSNMAAVPVSINRGFEASERASSLAKRVKLRSDSMRSNITLIRKLIEDTKAKAASIHQVSVHSTGKCAMQYKPQVSPSTTTEIVLNVDTSAPNNSLLYLARQMQDYLVVQMVNGKVSVTWDLGGGAGYVENPVLVKSVVSSVAQEKDWYRIEVFRQNQLTNLTVYQVANKSGTVQSVTASSPGSFSGLDVGMQDLLFVGGISNNTKVHSNVRVRSFTGCMGKAMLQGKSVGLWNFEQIENKEDCTGCPESPVIEPQRQQTNTYRYTGMSYSVLPLPAQHRQDNNRFNVMFQTFSSNGLIAYASSKDLPDFIALELNDGYVVLKINLGTGVYNVTTTKRYNNGKWVKVTVQRIRHEALLSTNRGGNVENKRMAIPNTDGLLNLTKNDYLCVGGAPMERMLKEGVTNVSFVGCLKEFYLGENLISLKRSGTGGVVRDSRVQSTCPAEITSDISIGNNGFVELEPINLTKDRSLSMTFNTHEPNAILMVGSAVKPRTKRRRRRRQTNDAFYSMYLLNGRVHVRIRTQHHGSLNLTSMYSIYDNGQPHLVTLSRNGTRVTLHINENLDQDSGVLPAVGNVPLKVRQLFIGGIPDNADIFHVAPTKRSINGCVRYVMSENLVNFLNTVEAKNALFGTCSEFQPVVLTSASPLTTRVVNVIPTPLKHRPNAMAIPPPRPPPITDPYCKAVKNASFYDQGDAVHFGLHNHSRVEILLTKKISKKFTFDLRVRTYAPDGLLLYARSTNAVDYFSLIVKDGLPIFQFDNGGGAVEGVGKKKINNGKWHRIRIKRTRRKGLISVDGKKTKFKSKKRASLMNVNRTLFVGGVSEEYEHKRFGKLTNSMDACVRDLTLNRKISLNFTAAKRVAVEPCTTAAESGAYFHGNGYAIFHHRYRVGTVMGIRMQFRTQASNAVFLSVYNGKDGLALEMVNGTIYFRVNNGDGPLEAYYTPDTGRNRGKFTLCDGKWHTITAEKVKNTLRLNVDGRPGRNTTTFMGAFAAADTTNNLYIGGLPDDEHEPSLLQTDQKFRGCIKDMVLKTTEVRFDDIMKREDVYPNSCPKQKTKKKKVRRSKKKTKTISR